MVVKELSVATGYKGAEPVCPGRSYTAVEMTASSNPPHVGESATFGSVVMEREAGLLLPRPPTYPTPDMKKRLVAATRKV